MVIAFLSYVGSVKIITAEKMIAQSVEQKSGIFVILYIGTIYMLERYSINVDRPIKDFQISYQQKIEIFSK